MTACPTWSSRSTNSTSSSACWFAETEGQALKVELLDAAGTVVRTAEPRADDRQASVILDVSSLAPGAHVLRIGHAEAQSGLSIPSLNVHRLPSFG